MKATKIALTRGLPKTRQTTEFRSGDDGTYEAGWWIGKMLANNKVRFIEKTIAGDDVVICRATGLMFPKNFSGAGGDNGNGAQWNNSIDFCNDLDFAGFTDWRLPNVFEMISISHSYASFPCIITPFTGVNTATGYWTSSTSKEDTAQAFVSSSVEISIYRAAKNTIKFKIPVRGGV